MTSLMDDPHSNPKVSSTASKRTRLMGSETGSGTTLVGELYETAEGEELIEPVVAWLVIIAGPGKGRSIQLSYGMSVIGRGEENRIVLDFGDDRISEAEHFSIAYDGENRDFHIVPGRGKNLVYLDSKPLLSAHILTHNTDLRVGSTTLRFVPFCSKDWDWATQPEKTG